MWDHGDVTMNTNRGDMSIQYNTIQYITIHCNTIQYNKQITLQRISDNIAT